MTKFKPYRRKVYYYETDKMSIMHHSNYIRIFEETRVDLLEQAGMPFSLISRALKYSGPRISEWMSSMRREIGIIFYLV